MLAEFFQQFLVVLFILLVQSQRVVVGVGVWCVHLTQHFLEVGLYVVFPVFIREGSHRIELVVCLKHLLYLFAENTPYLLLPAGFLELVVQCIERHHKQEVDVIVTYQQRISVEQSVAELVRCEVFVLLLCQPDGVAIAQVFLHRGADEEIRDDIVSLRHIVAQLRHLSELVPILFPVFVVLVAPHKQVQIPLNHVAGIGELLGHRLASYGMVPFVILRVADVVYGLVFLVGGQPLIGVDMVDHLAVILLLQSGGHLSSLSYQFVDNGFEHDVEVLYQQIVFLPQIQSHILGSVEESKAQLPQLDGFVREVFVLDLLQAFFSVSVQVVLEFSPCDQLIVAVNIDRKPVMFVDIVKDREEYD